MKAGESTSVSYIEAALIVLLTWGTALLIFLLLDNTALVFPLAALVTLAILAGERWPDRWRKAGAFCLRYRWALAALVFCCCVLLRLSGSSIGVYDEMFPTQLVPQESTLFGIFRWVRSDEYGVTTPKYFSQFFNHFALYSTQMSIHPTNMVLDYYSPVWGWTSLGKPLLWGFLLFGNEVGLSWYWCGEVILLFMTALELSLILTQGQVRASVLGAFLVAFSPEIQWWVMPHMPPVILYAMALFCVGYYFFTAETPLGKWGSALLAVIAAVGFALSIFPSFQVPCAYGMVALLVACLVRDRDRIHFKGQDVLRLCLTAAAIAGILLPFVLSSLEDLSLLMNTVYPGRRVSLGGDHSLKSLFPNLNTIFFPYLDTNYANNCEASCYVHFAPFFVALSPRMLLFLRKRRDDAFWPGVTLLCVLLVMAWYLVVGIPESLAELTLLRYCHRMHAIYDWCAVLFTVWGLAVLLREPTLLKGWQKLLYPALYLVCQLWATDENVRGYFQQFALQGRNVGHLVLALTLLGLGALLLLALFQQTRLLSAGLIALMLFCGATVNPIEQGVGALTNHPLSAAIQEIVEREPESRWLCTDTPFPLSNYVLANGAKVLSATNFYPDPEKWAILDPDGNFEEETNRYANQEALLTEEEGYVELKTPDYIQYALTPRQLMELQVTYLFTSENPTELLERNGISCQQLAEQDGYGIYHLIY